MTGREPKVWRLTLPRRDLKCIITCPPDRVPRLRYASLVANARRDLKCRVIIVWGRYPPRDTHSFANQTEHSTMKNSSAQKVFRVTIPTCTTITHRHG